MALSSSSSEVPVTPVIVAPTVANQMPNQGRTLLFNMDGSTRPTAAFYGEEYVPPYFRPVDLNSGLLSVRRALFGTNFDNAGMNNMLWVYMRILHSTEYKAYVTALDPRITYLTSPSLVDTTYGPSTNPNDNAIQFFGDPGLGAADGKMMTSWEVSFAGTTATTKNLQSLQSNQTVVTITDGLTSLIPMVDYPGLQIRLNLSIGTSEWIVDYLGAPSIDMDPISRAAQLANVGAEAYEELFPRRAPYILFRELWEKHTEFTYKMSGALLALMYRTNSLRVSGI